MISKQIKEGNSITFGVSEAFLIALAPVALYLMTYYFELGFASYFSIPRDLISINISTMLNSSISLMHSVAFLVVAYSGRVFVQQRPDYAAGGAVFGTGIWILFKSVVSLEFFANPYFLISTSFLLILLGIPLFTAFDFILSKFLFTRPQSPSRETNFIKDLMKRLHTSAFLSFLLIWGVYVIIDAGKLTAAKQKDFLVLPQEEIVVLRMYGDLMVTTSLSKVADINSRQLVAIRINNKERVHIKKASIGPIPGAMNTKIWN